MNKKIIQFNLEKRKEKEMPSFKAGDVVKVHRKIQEAGKERTQIFEGMVIATRGGQSSSPTITVRKVSYGVGVELVLPVLSSSVEKIEVVKRAKVRRSKLYYVREKTAKSLRFKFSEVGKEEKEEQAKQVEIPSKAEDQSVDTANNEKQTGIEKEVVKEDAAKVEEKKESAKAKGEEK